MATEQLRRREGASLEAAAAIEKAVRESLPAGSKEDANVEGLVKEALAALAGAGVTEEEVAAGAKYMDKYHEYDPTVRIAGGRITGPRAFPIGATHTFEADAPGPGPNEGRAIWFSPKPDFLNGTNFYTLEAIAGCPVLTRITYYSKTDKNDHLTGLWLGVLSPPLPSKEKFSGPGRFRIYIPRP